MSKKKVKNMKTRYETPILLPLGQLSNAAGQDTCNPGSGDSYGCDLGNFAGGKCNDGSSAGGDCNVGPSAGGSCSDGASHADLAPPVPGSGEGSSGEGSGFAVP